MKIHIVKIGGYLINDQEVLNSSLKAFCKLQGNKILIHGGGRKADFISNKMGISQNIIQGRRITDKETLDVVVMTYAGMINKNIVSILQSYHCNALGLCGADGNCIKSYLRKKTNIDYGYVGDLNSQSINTRLIKFLLTNNIIPVLCSITHDGIGTLLNTNADTIAAYMAISLSKEKNCETELHFCFEKKGVLRDMKDSESYYQKINLNSFQKMKQNHTIKNGMIPKLENAFLALKNGVTKVSIGLPNYLNDVNNKTILCL
ncbi:acetylglutamate kinase [Blattabacterium sp. (Blattella germanica) str. Bge]|uniref:acetylglutamate kinase n=1 Tax=Blattabacterium sp. (Blattella germanica) TaxID=624186 RepID=UPI0001BB6182|nr:acetylglutamate kinase [Blattabacterium sp. (Blattella germanica)]ACY40332.1 acetylglutamate kinase [Blattabacterium sp. (Blattella germanica) str. Bge]